MTKLRHFSVAAFAALVVVFAAHAVVLGNTGSPTNSRGLDLNCKGVALGAFPENGTANSISANISGTSGQSYRAFVLDSSGTSVVAASTIRTNISTQLDYTFTLAGEALTATTSYVLAICTTENSAAVAYFVSGTETYDGLSTDSGISSVDPLTFNAGGVASADSARDYTISLDYTASGGASGLLLRRRRN